MTGSPSATPGPEVLAMFPIGGVLLPHGFLPLHVFEPRYRALVADVLAGDQRFGVVLIERGHEVGGGDARFPVGTVAQVVQAQQAPDGRWGLATVGTDRFRVEEWLPDDPYPRARVTLLDEPVGDAPAKGHDALVAAVRERLARLHGLRAELGLPALADEVVLPADVVRASYEAALAAPLGPLDALALLDAPDATTRLERLGAFLDDEIEVCELRRSAGSD